MYHKNDSFGELEELLLPEGIEEIDDEAFLDCKNLRRAVFPSTLRRSF